jgi:hypothetical protein
VNRFAEVKNERISWHAGSRKDANDAGSHSVGPNPDRQSITNFVDID